MEFHASATGRIFMTYGPQELAEKVLSKKELQRFTPETITDQKVLAQKLDDIKLRGYEINRGEREKEVAAIAAPIYNHERNVEAALTVVGPVQRFSRNREDELISHLLEATRKLSELLGAPL